MSPLFGMRGEARKLQPVRDMEAVSGPGGPGRTVSDRPGGAVRLAADGPRTGGVMIAMVDMAKRSTLKETAARLKNERALAIGGPEPVSP